MGSQSYCLGPVSEEVLDPGAGEVWNSQVDQLVDQDVMDVEVTSRGQIREEDRLLYGSRLSTLSSW